MANVNVKTFGFGTIGFHDRIALGRSEIICFCYILRTGKFSQNASSFTYDLKASGWRFLCTELAIVIHFESIWSHQGTHFGSLFGTRLAHEAMVEEPAGKLCAPVADDLARAADITHEVLERIACFCFTF